MAVNYVDSGLGWAVDSRFFKSTPGNLAVIGGRTFYTTHNGSVIFATVYSPAIGYTGPVVISTSRDIVGYEPGGATGTGRFDYLSFTWYITSVTYWMSGNQADTSGISQKLNLTGSTAAEIGVAVLKAASVVPTEYSKTSTTKVYYNGSSKVIKRLCQIINSVARLGITHDKAFYGDLGQEAYDHSQTIGNPHQTSLADLGIENIQKQIDMLLDTVGSVDAWIDHEDDFEFVDHTDETIMFVSGSILLKLH